MLLVAKIFTKSAPSATTLRTKSRICAGAPVFSLTERSDVRIRGPGTVFSAVHVLRYLSISAPGLCTVVKPDIRML
jgi:hypothetical protein